jgi:hypothetical protein
MSVTIWQGTVTSPYADGSQVTFTLDPATAAITAVGSRGLIAFVPAPGYPDLSGTFSSAVTFDPAALPAGVADAWAAAAGQLIILDPAKTYTMTITEI